MNSVEVLAEAITSTANAVSPAPTRFYEWYETPNEFADHILAASPRLAAALELGLAFADAEAALPEGWDGPELRHELIFNGREAEPLYGPEREWVAYSWLPDRKGANAYRGSTPALALRNLIERLKA